MKPTTLIIALLATTTTVKAQQLNIPKGKTFEITSTTKQSGTFKQDSKQTYAFKSLGKDAAGNNVLEVKLVHAYIFDADYAKGKVVLNTDSIRNTNFQSTQVLAPVAMLEKPFILTVSPIGEIVKVDGVDEILKKSYSAWNIQKDIVKQEIANIKSGFKISMGEYFFKQPGTGKPPGTKPDVRNQAIELPFKMISNTGGTITMQASSKSDSGTYDRKYILDAKSGLVKKGVRQQDIHYDVPATANTGGKMVLKSTATITMREVQNRKPIDTAWLNMAVRMGSWSDYLKKGSGSDSVKIYNLARNRDQRFINDPYYNSRLLSAIQSIRGDKSYKVYDSLLYAMPDELLADNSSHLHNKLHGSRDQGPAALYSTAKYAAKAGSLPDWIDDSFSQGFLDQDYEGFAKRQAKDYELLQYLYDKNNNDIKDLIGPLYIWAMAKKDRTDLDQLKRAGLVFKNMDDKHMKKGNGPRYALLTYQLLDKAGQTAEATALMDNIVKRLEQYSADTLNKARYQHQNMLAGAYYMKYQTLNKTGSADASKYLALAAKLSPSSAKEKAYASFYDRVFLNTKESYRDIFIDKMLNSGNEEEALVMFAEHVTAMPDNIEQMKQLYAKKFPGKDFKAFFNDRIMSQWQNAPAFTLTNVDGSKNALTDYKGKWLVMDFWGTWCGPCCEELPTVNRFSEKVKAGDYQNVNFLSVSCYDEEDHLKTFLADNKYTLPVAVSDGKIQKDYNIRGYPSKIIVSPEGKMITVDFGKDWQSVIKSFSQM